MHAFDRLTDGRTDGQTEFSLLFRVCIPCSALKTRTAAHLRERVTDRLSVTTVMDVSQLYRAYVTTCGHVDSVELWNVKVMNILDPTGATYELYDDACVILGHSPVDIDSHKLSSWKVVHQCALFTLVNDLSAVQFVTINVDWTVTSNDTYVDISRPSSIQQFSGIQGVCVGRSTLFTNAVYHLNFDQFCNLYRQSNHQSHIFLISSACLVSC